VRIYAGAKQMKYLILLVAMLTTVAEAKEPLSSCLRVKDVNTEKVGQRNETYIGLTLESSCPVKMEAPDGLPVFEFQDADGLQTTVASTDWLQSGIFVVLQVEASKDAALGNQKLHGLMHYKGLVSGSYADEILSLDVPVKVVQPKPVETSFADDHPVWDKVLLAGMIIVAIPYCVLMLVIGHPVCGG
jgi:hypothetical protein